MCGIGGTIGIEGAAAQRIAAILANALGHRGPDDGGMATVVPGRDSSPTQPPVVLAHRRLAVIDLSPSGHQPMSLGTTWLAFNGEIYNYRELDADARNDTEAILRAYRTHGTAAVERIRGMFAWCLVDPAIGRIWLCRDRLGIKPLYHRRLASGGLVFASELRALLVATDEDATISPPAMESFLAQGAVWGEDSFVSGISLLPPGTSMIVDFSGRVVEEKRFWQLEACFRGQSRAAPGRAAATQLVGKALRKAVGEHLVSDVPLGVFLSGGIDSTAIACLASEASADIRTLCIGFDQPEADESEAAARTAKALGAKHTTIRLTGESVLAHFDEGLAAIDQPTIDGFNTYFVAKAARAAGLTVALSGLGGDELFCGYASFRDAPRAARWARPLAILGSLAGLGARRWPPVSRAEAKVWEAARRGPDLAAAYLLRRELFLPAARRSMGSTGTAADGLPAVLRQTLGPATAGLPPLQAVSFLELSGYMRHMLLRDADVFSMASGLELRVPLLDHGLVELVAGLPAELKDPARGAKRLLVDAVGARFPANVYGQPKRGFAFPWDAWLRGALRDRAADAVMDRERWVAIGVAPNGPATLWAAFLRRDGRISALQILALIVLHDFTRRWKLASAPCA